MTESSITAEDLRAVEVSTKGRTCLIIETTTGADVAEGCFISEGDHVTAWDKRADGLRVRVDWMTDYDRDGDCRDNNSDGGRVDCNFDMREDGRLKFQVELWDGDQRYAETGWTGWLSID
ncbi:MAG: hypothetical protein HOV94_10950 [Saccharothrix sp.]|nr:hypothetical protein [Saccharothrix sp.]